MPRNFVTLFDSFFLPQGLALYRSMQREISQFTLWIVCMDEAAYSLLDQLKLLNVRLIRLADIETPELLAVKGDRTVGEYCWTVTPFVPSAVFLRDKSVLDVTYVDADLWFRKDPESTFAELEASGKSVLITEHHYSPEHDHSNQNGIFCVQFMIFKRDHSAPVLKWWQEKCVEWCYARFEKGLFGDQKYLEEWPVRFSSLVHTLSLNYPVLAPWNMTRIPYSTAFAVHFHGLRLIDRNRLFIAPIYRVPEIVMRKVYSKYLDDIEHAVIQLEGVNFQIKSQCSSPTLLESVTAKLRNLYWLMREMWRPQTIYLSRRRKA